MADYYSTITGQHYGSKEQMEAMEKAYMGDLAKKQADELKRANDIQQKMYEDNMAQRSAEALRRAEMEFDKFIEMEQKKRALRKEMCETVGLNHRMLEEFRLITTSFDWNEYLYKNRDTGAEILEDLDCLEVQNKLVDKISIRKSYYQIFMFLLICGIFGTLVSLMAEQLALAIMAIIMSVIFGIPTAFAKRSYSKSMSELDKLKQFFENYASAGKEAYERLNLYREENYNKLIDDVISSVLGIEPSNKAKKTRVEALNDSKLENIKLSDEVSEKYNYAIANILDDYDKQIKAIVEELRKDFMM